MKWFFRKIKNLVKRILRIRKSILIPSLAVVLVLLGFGIFKLVEFANYVEHDPEFCLSCHIMESAWEKWETSEHSDQECHSCHKLDIIQSAGQLFNYTFRGVDTITTHAEVENELCTDCHVQNNPVWIKIAASEGHINHTEVNDVFCINCHSGNVHSFAPMTDICTDCHTDITHGEGFYCIACHDFN